MTVVAPTEADGHYEPIAGKRPDENSVRRAAYATNVGGFTWYPDWRVCHYTSGRDHRAAEPCTVSNVSASIGPAYSII